jgi:hypothetical protein
VILHGQRAHLHRYGPGAAPALNVYLPVTTLSSTSLGSTRFNGRVQARNAVLEADDGPGFYCPFNLTSTDNLRDSIRRKLGERRLFITGQAV